MEVGQSVSVRADAYPDTDLKGAIARLAPVFQSGSRQARVELTIANEIERLKPWMFIRVQVEVGRASDARIIPAMALANRSDEMGVFLVNQDTTTVSWQPVEVGIR